MKSYIRSFAVALIMVILGVAVITVIPSTTAINSQAAVTITKKVTVKVGSTAKIKLNGNKKAVTWSLSNKNALFYNTTTSSATIVGLKQGTVTATAKVGSKKYTCKITVKKKNNNVNDDDSSSTNNTSSKGKVVYNKNNIKITYLGLEKRYSSSYYANFRIENKSSKKIFVSVDYSSSYINGYMHYLGSLGTVMPNTNRNDYFLLSFDSLRRDGIDPEKKLKASFIWDIHEYDTYVDIDNETKCSITF